MRTFLSPSGTARPAAVAVVAGLLLAGCAAPATAPSVERAAVQRPAAAPSPSAHSGHAVQPVAARAAGVRTQAGGAPSQAVQLRSTLERLLGAHQLLADELVRAHLGDDAARTEGAQSAVDANRKELAENVSRLAGVQAGGAFGKAWEEHIAALVDYAGALKDDDAAAKTAAAKRFAAAEDQLGAALAQVVGDAVPRAGIDGAVDAHYTHLLGQADAYAARDFRKAYAVAREGFAHMIMVADVLARGIAQTKGLPAGDLDAPRRGLQSALSHLLAEHMGLMVQGMRASHDGAPDLEAAGTAINGNTTDLAKAFTALYGQDAGRQFLQVWGPHVEGLVGYAADGDADEAARQEQTRTQVAGYAPSLAKFLATATEQRLPAIALAASLTEHDTHLREQADAYAEGDQAAAQQASATGYGHMFELAQTLATAIGDAVAARLPTGGAATGGGGLAGHR